MISKEVRYSRGACMNVVRSDGRQWQSDANQLRKLPGVQHVEIWLEYIPSEAETKFLRDLLEGLTVIVHGPCVHCSLVSHVKPIVDVSVARFRQAIAFAQAMSARVVTFHAGTYPVFEEPERALAQVCRLFQEFARETVPVITLENMPTKGGGGASRQCLGHLRDLVELKTLLPEIRFTLDVGHSIHNGDDYLSFVKKYRDSIANIHLHDAIRGGRSHLPIGEGVLDLAAFVELLDEIEYHEFVTLETITYRDTSDSWRSLAEVTTMLMSKTSSDSSRVRVYR